MNLSLITVITVAVLHDGVHDLESRGVGIGPMDTLIAAQALRLGATVITRNVREFGRVPGLKVENWQD